MTRVVETAIGDLARYINGRGFKPAEWGKVGLPIVRIANLNDPKAPFDFYDGPLDEGHRITNGDIVVSWSASLDAYVWDRGDAALNQHIFKVIPRTSVVAPEYLFYVLKLAIGGLLERVHGATMQHVTRPEFETFSLPIHRDLHEQRRVANRLKTQLAEVETARQAARRQAGDIALLRVRLLKEMLATLDGVQCKVLGDHAPTTSGTTPPRGTKRYWEPAEIPWVKTGEVAFAPVTRTEEAVSRAALDECSLTLLPPRTVLVAMYGQGKTRGQSAILEVAATTNQACLAILPNDTWEPEFLYYWLVASYQDLRDLSEDRGGNQANLNGALLKALEVPAPDRAQQLEVVHRIKAALHELDVLTAAGKARLTELELLPQRLLAQAFEN